ncbi:PREDICTED: uncharacterized protein LOC104719350 [Camelina sativa]|uniref:Uncharacterized protein LOC104719350 n=1 Tax=Camelina sativa TaxID=90675 RepID=A0ABM0U478_CAMSA|nr:PREDICTED: uncharacterized protein LOC104719350 [Camelina sativa]
MDQRFEKRTINVLLADHLDKHKVVWLHSGNDFVDLLYSFLTMPLGTIVRLLENHGRLRQTVTLGCLNNLYKSVVDMNIDNFRTEACKQMLVYPKSVKESQCKMLKINIDVDTEATKHFMCPMYLQRKSCREFFSNFNTSRCSCGNLMKKEISSPEGEEFASRLGGSCDYDGVFVHGDGNLAFILSDDLKIENFSRELFRKRVKDLGCVNGLDEIGEGEAELGFREAMTFLRSLFASDTPLTTTFYPFNSSTYPSKRAFKPSSSPCDSVLGQVLSLTVYLSKQDKRKVMYAKCGEGFIDLLCTFLVLPLEYICEISASDDGCDDGLGCIGNLFRSFKGLSCGEITIPWYYRCRKNLLGVPVQTLPSFYSCFEDHAFSGDREDRLKKVRPMDPKTEISDQSRSSGGFVKSNKKFLVSDDLIITPLNTDLTVRDLKRFKISFDEVNIEEITIGRTEAINLLKASFVTSSALSDGLSDLLTKKLEAKEDNS